MCRYGVHSGPDFFRKGCYMLWRGLDIDDLFILGILAEGHTMSGAAKILNLTQPAVSQRIKKIKAFLNCDILAKNGVRCVLTARGMEIAKAAREAVVLLDRTVPTNDGSRSIAFHS